MYSYDWWMSKQKWQGFIVVWDFKIPHTNTCIIYCMHHKMHLNEPVSHYNFVEIIVLTWLYKKYGPKKQSIRKFQNLPSNSLRSLIRSSAWITMHVMNNLPTRTIGAVVQSSNSSTNSCTIPKRTFYPINTLLWWVKIPFLSTWTTYEEIQSLPDLQVGVTKAELIEKNL